MSFELPSSSPNSGRSVIGGVNGSGSGSNNAPGGATLRKRGMNLARSISQDESVRKSVVSMRTFDMWRHVRKEYVGTSYPAMVSGTSAGGLLSLACGIVMIFLVLAEYAGHRSVYTTSAVVMNSEEDARFRLVKLEGRAVTLHFCFAHSHSFLTRTRARLPGSVFAQNQFQRHDDAPTLRVRSRRGLRRLRDEEKVQRQKHREVENLGRCECFALIFLPPFYFPSRGRRPSV